MLHNKEVKALRRCSIFIVVIVHQKKMRKMKTFFFVMKNEKINTKKKKVLETPILIAAKNKAQIFFMWDRECTELIGQSANEVNKLKIEVPNQIIIRCFLTFE